MLTNGVLNPWKAAASLPALLYAALLFMKLPNTGLVLTALAVVLLAVLWFIANQGYSFWAAMPAIVGGALLLICGAALIGGVSEASFVPVSRAMIELWFVCGLAVGYVAWGIYESLREV